MILLETLGLSTEDRLTLLENALRESVKLQAHYGTLLNMHDGGKRKIFNSAEEWVERLLDIGTVRASGLRLHVERKSRSRERRT